MSTKSTISKHAFKLSFTLNSLIHSDSLIQCTWNNKLFLWRGNGTVPTTLFPAYSCTIKYVFHGSPPDTPNYLSPKLTYCYNPMYLEIHLCQNTLAISALQSQLRPFLIMPQHADMINSAQSRIFSS